MAVGGDVPSLASRLPSSRFLSRLSLVLLPPFPGGKNIGGDVMQEKENFVRAAERVGPLLPSPALRTTTCLPSCTCSHDAADGVASCFVSVRVLFL